MPRPILCGDRRPLNKRVLEALADQVYNMEMRGELGHQVWACPKAAWATGDYRPAESKYGLSRKMLEVCLELGFPVSVMERSPLALGDLGLLKAINERARAVMMWSIIYAPDPTHRSTLRELVRLVPLGLTPTNSKPLLGPSISH